jgi:acylphosphatase
VSTDLASLQATVHGRVQGVFFRDFVARYARELKLTGYVRNLRDGSVEVCAEGERPQLEKLVEHIKVGPPHARVREVITRWSEYTGNYTGFRVGY